MKKMMAVLAIVVVLGGFAWYLYQPRPEPVAEAPPAVAIAPEPEVRAEPAPAMPEPAMPEPAVVVPQAPTATGFRPVISPARVGVHRGETWKSVSRTDSAWSRSRLGVLITSLPWQARSP